jgi:hypothetical protein
MWPFRSKPKPQSDHYGAWLVAEGCPRNFVKHPDAAVRNRWIDRLGEIRQTIYNRHLQSLDDNERRLIETANHPSQSWRFAAEAEPFAPQLRDRLRARGHEADVSIGYYQCDRIVLSAELPAPIPESELWKLPAYFHGFEIKYCFPVPKTETPQ